MKTAVQSLVSAYIDKMGIRYSHVCKATGIDKRALYDILKLRRELRADEYMKICAALDVSPDKFNTEVKEKTTE